MIKKVTIPEHEEYQDEKGNLYKSMEEALHQKRLEFIEERYALTGHVPFHSAVYLFEEMLKAPELMQEEPKEDYEKYYFRELQEGELLQDGDIYYMNGSLFYSVAKGKTVDRNLKYYRREKYEKS